MLPLSKKGSDNFQTPEYAVKPLLSFISQSYVIWEPACGDGNIVNFFKKNNYDVISSDIEENFLTYKPGIIFDIIVTNPPYSIKNEFLKKCYEWDKAFALLVPLTILETNTRQSLYKEHGLQMLFLNKRVNFITPSKSGSWFATFWLCYKLLPENIMFAEINQ